MGPAQPTSSGASLAVGRRALSARYGLSRARAGDLRLAFLFLAPAVLIYFVFMVVPFLNTLYLSLTDWNGFDPVPRFVGIQNYAELLGDEEFWRAIRNNATWALVGTAAPIVIAVPIAIALWSGTRFMTFFRTIFFIPHILPVVVIAIVWAWIYHPIYGVPVLKGILGSKDTALFGILIPAIWGTYGFVLVVLLAGLQSVNMDLVDASKVDGANAFQRTRHVILPQIAPIMTTITTITLIGAFSVFDIVFIMTSGGPGGATTVLAVQTFSSGFRENRQGYGSAISMVITVISLVLTVLVVKFRERSYRDVY
jgi:raffinose/stachyose/melibiose transport system permease protein